MIVAPVSIISTFGACVFMKLNSAFLDLAGWQLDKLAETPKRQVEDVSDSDSDEDIPFACLICRKPYTDPVVTRCGHYYCSSCAIKRYARNPKCLACSAPTGGIFNRADKVIAKLNKTQSNQSEDKETGADNGAIEIEGLADQGNESAPSEGEEGSEDEE
jgi:RING finger protein 113A